MKRMYSAVPGRVYVATRAHSAIGERELSLSKGDKVKGQFYFGSPIYPSYFHLNGSLRLFGFMFTHLCFCLYISVLSVGEGGYWEGTVKGRTGWFPSDCVEEVVKDARSGAATQSSVTAYFQLLLHLLSFARFNRSESVIFCHYWWLKKDSSHEGALRRGSHVPTGWKSKCRITLAAQKLTFVPFSQLHFCSQQKHFPQNMAETAASDYSIYLFNLC